jgi:hypothetical protein
MKTAVEILADELKKNHRIDLRLYDEFNQAKEMEKEQIRIAYMEGAFEKMRHLDGKEFTMPTDYYNETFKSE